MQQYLEVAKKEFLDHIRNGWVIAIAISFMVFACIITLAGLGFTGEVGVGDNKTTLMSLSSLVFYLVPLLGLLLGYDSIAGERERGTLDLLLSYPISTHQIIVGKWIGLVCVLFVTLFLGLIVPTIIGLSFGQTIGQWFALLMMSTWLGLIFLTLALWLSTYPWERAKLLGISIGLWLVLVILFDVGFIGLLVATSGELSNTIVENIFYINPASLLRFLMIQTMFDQSVINELGLQGSIPGVFSLLIALLIWSALPLVLAARKMSRY